MPVYHGDPSVVLTAVYHRCEVHHAQHTDPCGAALAPQSAFMRYSCIWLSLQQCLLLAARRLLVIICIMSCWA